MWTVPTGLVASEPAEVLAIGPVRGMPSACRSAWSASSLAFSAGRSVISLRSVKVCATTSTCAGCGEVKPGGAPPSQVAQETSSASGSCSAALEKLRSGGKRMVRPSDGLSLVDESKKLVKRPSYWLPTTADFFYLDRPTTQPRII
jgi:hypothetical protein